MGFLVSSTTLRRVISIVNYEEGILKKDSGTSYVVEYGEEDPLKKFLLVKWIVPLKELL